MKLKWSSAEVPAELQLSLSTCVLPTGLGTNTGEIDFSSLTLSGIGSRLFQADDEEQDALEPTILNRNTVYLPLSVWQTQQPYKRKKNISHEHFQNKKK